MQRLVRVPVSVEVYVGENFHRRVLAPSSCPNCGRFDSLWGHGFYRRFCTDAHGKPIGLWVRRFLCRLCRVTLSCLPRFAQPYRLVNHTTLEAFIKGDRQRRDVQVQLDLLHRYRRRFTQWLPDLLAIIGLRFGRASPQEAATAFWTKAVAACGSAGELTEHLTDTFRTTCFRTYRCHQPALCKRPLRG